MSSQSPSFAIPGSLQDLEREPYNLLPYPEDFDDENEAARAESFDALVHQLETGNRTLVSGGMSTFYDDQIEVDPWNGETRIQALYTLVRKSSSLAPSTKARLVDALCKAVHGFSNILGTSSQTDDDSHSEQRAIAPSAFRDAFACHLYMLFSIMFLTESEAKVTQKTRDPRRSEDKAESDENIAQRAKCAHAMLAAANAMCDHKGKLWPCGIPDEALAILPCRIAYQMLETATGVVARKAASADEALGMIAATVNSSTSFLGTIVAALMDLLHSYEHISPLVAELCSMVNETPVNRLAVELIREVGRLDSTASFSDTGLKASGIKNLAPFIGQLAQVRPRIVLANISHLLPHLNSEPYNIRSSIVTAIGHILVNMGNHNSDEPSQTKPEMSTIDLSKSRNALLDVLRERVLDTSSYTRSTVLKTWTKIVQTGCLPLERLISVTSFSIDRLQDKTVIVRRGAMQLVTALLEHNPFLGSLEPLPYRKKLAEVYEELKGCLPAHIKEASASAMAEARESGDETSISRVEQATLATAIEEADSMLDRDDLPEEQRLFLNKVQGLKFAQAALDFIDTFEQSNKEFHGMLLSANTSDVTEALRFFVRARQFKLPCAVTGMKQALSLMWSNEKSIREEVLRAFIDAFIAIPGTEGKEFLPEKQIAHNLLYLVGRATVSELASIEEAIGKLVKDEMVPNSVFLVLWSIASKSCGDARATALLILGMGASADRSIVDSASRLKLLLESGVGEEVEESRDWKTMRSAAYVLQRVQAPTDPLSAKALVLEQIVERLGFVVRGDWCRDTNSHDTEQWFAATEHAISALFVVCLEPELECAEIIRTMSASIFGSENMEETDSCSDVRLARFFFVLGHVALKILVYTEGVSGSVRRANAKRMLRRQETADKEKMASSSVGDENDGIEDQLGVAAEQEAENEKRVADITDKEILGRGLISKFAPLVIRVVANEQDKFSSDVLRTSATLALCKFMCISSSSCEANLPLLFTTLKNAEDTTLRANIVVALGDHAFRFPNEVEPYTPRLYACLRDPTTKVRRHTLMVLTHLILNDMIKVKGQVSEITLCLRDDDARIRDMSRLLFLELSKRSNNPIYNLLPDIISQLSQQLPVRPEDFRSIMSFLIGFIKHERQNETLIDKLCQRFPKCSSITQKSDLAFCLSLLRVNERSVKCLIDSFKLYKDALADDSVQKSFLSIVTKARKTAKPEMKQLLEDWEEKLTVQARIGQENQIAGEKASKAKAKAKRKASRRKKRNHNADMSFGSDDGEMLLDDKENINLV